MDRNSAYTVDLYVAVHTVFTFESDEYHRPDLRPENFFRHSHEFFSEFGRVFESDAEVRQYVDVDDLIEFIWGLDEKRSVKISGELHNLFQGHAVQIVKYIATEGSLSPEILRDVVFPRGLYTQMKIILRSLFRGVKA